MLVDTGVDDRHVDVHPLVDAVDPRDRGAIRADTTDPCRPDRAGERERGDTLGPVVALALDAPVQLDGEVGLDRGDGSIGLESPDLLRGQARGEARDRRAEDVARVHAERVTESSDMAVDATPVVTCPSESCPCLVR